MRKNQLDYWIFYTVLALMAFGIIMVYSASAFYADKFRHDHLYYLKRQLLWVFVGIVLMMIAYKFPYEKLQKKTFFLLLISLFLLVYLYASGGGRWIRMGPFNIQVSDVARLSLIFFLADSLSRKEQYLKSFSQGFVPHVFYIVFLAGLIVIQPDFSSAFMLTMIGMAILFVAPIPVRYFAVSLLTFTPVAALIIKFSSYKFARVEAFLHPEQDNLGKGYQILQSLYSLGAGGITGVGFARSNQKLFFLPEAHTDFIFSIIGEEWGFLGTVFVLILFFILMWRGILIIKNIPDRFSKYLAFGLTANIIFYALINMMVAANLAPPTGLPLPFVSYGGSFLITACLSAGLLLNISARAFYDVQVRNYQFASRAVQNFKNRKLNYIK
ncbi:MAG: putative lipid II flippase FtsW [Calditrichaeota bacterium]|nr:putative lipid II flippase FtsW [Calditrichota bacterium]RQV99713.1 MAG: putative lipid II flippase FtsW [Calditrichota bacterium]